MLTKVYISAETKVQNEKLFDYQIDPEIHGMLSEVLLATQVWGSADQNHEEDILNMLGDVYSAANLKALHDGQDDDWFDQEI